MNSVLVYKPPSNQTSRAKDSFQTTGRLAISSSTSATQGTISQRIYTHPHQRKRIREMNRDTHGGELPKEGTMAKKGYQFPSKNRGVTPDDDDDFEVPELHDLLKAVDEKKNERKERGAVTDGHHELTERERHDILVAARNIRNERLQSQGSPELVLVNVNHVENSREIRPGDSQENPIILNDDDDNNNHDDDGGNNDTTSNGAKDDTQLDGNSKENSPKAETLSGSMNSRRDDIFRATQEDVREETGQPLQCEASVEPEHDSLSEAYAWVDLWDEHESSTEPATPCICDGGPGDCGARQHESIEQYSFRQPSVNINANRLSGPNEQSGRRSCAASEPSPQPEPVVPQQMFRRAPGPSPSPDEARYSSVDASLQRSLSSRKRSHPVEDDTPPKRSRRTRKETWKVREAREMAALGRGWATMSAGQRMGNR